jgi:hypothetical protein
MNEGASSVSLWNAGDFRLLQMDPDGRFSGTFELRQKIQVIAVFTFSCIANEGSG